MNEFELFGRCSEKGLSQYSERLGNRADELLRRAARVLTQLPFHPSLYSEADELMERAVEMSCMQGKVIFELGRRR